MAAAFKAGDKAYIVESNRIIRECMIIRVYGNLYIIKFQNGGGIQVPRHRLFPSKEEAEESVPTIAVEKKQRKYQSPYEYWH